MTAMLARAAAVWSGLMVTAVANGTLRVFVIDPLTGGAVGHVVSTLLLCVLILFIAGLSSITGPSYESAVTAGVFLYRLYSWFLPIPLAWILLKVTRRGRSKVSRK